MKLKRKPGCGGPAGKPVRPTIAAGSSLSVRQEAEEKLGIQSCLLEVVVGRAEGIAAKCGAGLARESLKEKK